LYQFKLRKYGIRTMLSNRLLLNNFFDMFAASLVVNTVFAT